MKKAFALILSFCLLLQCGAHYMVRGLFEWNKEYIAANLCENKAKPEMNCCGQCVLKKEQNKVDEENAPAKNAPTKVQKYEVVSLLPAVFSFATAATTVVVQPVVQNPRGQHLHNGGLRYAVFHPPTSAV